MNRWKRLLMIAGLILLTIDLAHAVELREDGKNYTIIPDKASEQIKIDAVLNENIWNQAPIGKDFITFIPMDKELLGQKAEIWLAYDRRNLYFAGKCYDTNPDKIKTSITRRDNISTEDWLGIIIDSMGNRQASYEFYINPNGIQEDGITSAVNSFNMEKAHDFVWESAAKITTEGYQFEVRIPLGSIRFKGGKETKMGIMFMRNVSREGKMGSWPAIEDGQPQFNFMATVLYEDLQKMLNLEVLPNFTFSKNAERGFKNKPGWEKDTPKNIGVSLKYGITSSITTEATINPDFSQVESDAFQVEFNQRYPIYYNEKRPFFMEGINAFEFSLITQGQGMMMSTVYTRNIIDPGWAAKLSGTTGKILFAFLASNDEKPFEFGGKPIGLLDESFQEKDAYWGIARAKYYLGSDNSFGILFSGHHLAGGKNDVLGADLQYRFPFFRRARFNLSYLHSMTRMPDEDVKHGNSLNAMFQYTRREITAWSSYEYYGQDFIMDSAFLIQGNISRVQIYAGPNFYPQKKSLSSWLLKIQPYVKYTAMRDLELQKDGNSWQLGVNLSFPLSAYGKIEFHKDKEPWNNAIYRPEFISAFGAIQLFKWLYIEGSVNFGDKIRYDLVDTYLGKGKNIRLKSTIQSSLKLSLNVEFIHDDIRRNMNESPLLNQEQKPQIVNIFNVLAIYQFNKYFFIRGAIRYADNVDNKKKLVTDFLASFTLIPGTVVHLGYGSLYENKEWQIKEWVYRNGPLLNMKNSLFFKVSYLWRIK